MNLFFEIEGCNVRSILEAQNLGLSEELFGVVSRDNHVLVRDFIKPERFGQARTEGIKSPLP